MNAALRMLLGLQLKSYFRFFTRSLKTIKGALLALVGLLVFVPWLIMVAFGANQGPGIDPEQLRTNGPLYLLAYCLLQVLFSASENSIYFTPAEVQFLFTGPFTRRQILVYKVVLLTMLTLPVPMLFALLFRHHAGNWFSAVAAMSLGILFLNLFTLAINLFVDLLGAALYSRARKVVLFVVLVGVLVGLSFGGMTDWRSVAEQASNLGRSPVVRILVWPVSWFFELFLASEVLPFLIAFAMAVLVDFAMLLVVFALDRNFLEVAAGNSVRMYERIQQMRSGQSALAIGGSSKLGLPDFPYWGGIGPVFWRQATQALRGMVRLVFILTIIGVGVMFGLSTSGGKSDDGAKLLGAGTGILIWLTVFLTMLVPFDFRGDVDRMALLKSLPTPTWAIVIGQLLTPTVVTTLFHWIVLAGLVVMARIQGEALSLGAVLALALLFPAFNFLMFGVENLLFLIFPIRLTQNTPGDFQSVGRNVLLTLGKLLILLIVLGVAGVASYWTYLTMGQNIYLAVGVAWMVLTTFGIALVPPMMVAFHHFDVGRDTPP